MRIYQRDEEERIGGVGGTESPVSPLHKNGKSHSEYRMEVRDRFQLQFGRLLDSVEYRAFRDPLFMEGEERSESKTCPWWLGEEGATPADVIPGFRMSFRTRPIKRVGFDENLGRYALFEDYDASLAVAATHLLVNSSGAKVFHLRSPGKRVNGLEWGLIQVLNRAYVICKHSHPGSKARQRVIPYSYYKLIRYLVQASTSYGRQRVKGTVKALSLVTQILSAPSDLLPAVYKELRNRSFPNHPDMVSSG
jgi:hypothetical protein